MPLSEPTTATFETVLSKSCKEYSRGRIHLIDGSSMLVERYIDKHLSLKEMIKDCHELAPYFSDPASYVKEVTQLIIKNYTKSKFLIAPSELTSGEVDEYIMGLVPVVDLDDHKKTILFDANNRKVVTYDFEHWVQVNQLKIAEAKALVKRGRFTFDPWVLESFYYKELDRVKTLFINFYSPPKWRHLEVSPVMPEIIEEFLNHLFPNEKAKRYIYHWLYNLIVKRNQTYLCLIGARGVGKNIFAEELCGALVGLDHFDKVGDSLLEDKFNAPLKNKRLIILDEVDVDQDRKVNRLKSFGNDMIPIESKGKDSKKETNYNSFIIATNSLDGMKFGPEERRFSIPEISEIKLDHVWNSDKISHLVKELRDPDSQVVADFGNWILQNGKILEQDEFYCYKGAYFFEILHISMADWQKTVVDEIVNNPKKIHFTKNLARIHLASLKDNNPDVRNSMFPKANGAKMTTFLKNYLHMGRDKIGVVEKRYCEEKSREEWAIIPSEKFTPEHDFTEVKGYESKEVNV